MRRRNVPCSPCSGGSSGSCGCCGLKEKLRILWDRTIGSILKINDITPDGDGNFTIEAGQNIILSEVGTGNGIKIDALSTIETDWSDIDNKPDTVAGYGIIDAVDLTSDQDIMGIKSIGKDQPYISGTIPGQYLVFKTDNEGGQAGYILPYRSGTDEASIYLSVCNPRTGYYKGSIGVHTDNIDEWATAPDRSYNSANIQDIVTIGSLASNPSVVHTTGNETVQGTKNFMHLDIQGFQNGTLGAGKLYAYDAGQHTFCLASVQDASNIAELAIKYENGTAYLILGKTVNGVYSSTTIATI